jgi:hypothetical protein
MMRRTLFRFSLFVLLVPGAAAGGLGPAKPWYGGMYVQTSGYSESTGLPAASWFGAGVFFEPLDIPVLNPLLAAGLVLPVAPCRASATRLELTGELTLFDSRLPLLAWVSYAALRWSPAVGLDFQLSLADGESSWSLLAFPVRIRAGDAIFTLGGVQLFFQGRDPWEAWGVVLFKAMLFLF